MDHFQKLGLEKTIDSNRYHIGHVKLYPGDAARLLSFNKNNRPISVYHVSKHVRDIENGRWARLNPHGIVIVFDSNGKYHIADGQHRLTSIVKSGVACEIAICFVHLDDTSNMHVDLAMDMGTKRRTHFQVGMSKDSCAVAGFVLKLMRRTSGGVFSAFEIAETASKFSPYLSYVNHKNTKLFRSSPILACASAAACWYMRNGYSPDIVSDQFELLVNNDQSSMRPGILCLNTTIYNMMRRGPIPTGDGLLNVLGIKLFTYLTTRIDDGVARRYDGDRQMLMDELRFIID